MAQIRSYTELFVPEDAHALAARERSADVGCGAISPAVAATLTFAMTAIGARSVVEIGTGAGVSGLALLAGMAPDGVLTSVDIETEYQRLARASFTEAGHASTRFRLINGRALDVLPRLTDGAYDAVFVDGPAHEFHPCIDESLRLLRPGGVLMVHGLLADEGVADPTVRDPDTATLRDVARTLRDDERLVPALLPIGAGLLAAALRPDTAAPLG